MLLRHIRYLLAVAEHANFTRAAEALHVSQPTLSQQVKQLEGTLHAKLLDRSGFNVRYPGISLTVNEMTQDRIEDELADDLLDLGIAFTDTPSSTVEAEPLFRETLTLVVGSGHPLAETRTPLAFTDFAQHDLVLLDEGFATRQHIDRYFRQQRVTPRVAVETNSVSAIIELVRRGRLATVLPDATALHHVDLSFVSVGPPLPERTVVLLRRAGAHHSAASRPSQRSRRKRHASDARLGWGQPHTDSPPPGSVGATLGAD